MSNLESSSFLLMARFFSSSNSYSFERSIFIARSRFLCCERSFWQATTIPVGIWVIRTAESVSINPKVFLLDVHLDGFINFRRDKDAGKRGMAALGLVKRRNAHQTVYPDLARQQSVGIVAGDCERGRFDSGFFGRLIFVYFSGEALALSPAQVHAQQHLRPVL